MKIISSISHSSEAIGAVFYLDLNCVSSFSLLWMSKISNQLLSWKNGFLCYTIELELELAGYEYTYININWRI
jgi:hypothetical protein